MCIIGITISYFSSDQNKEGTHFSSVVAVLLAGVGISLQVGVGSDVSFVSIPLPVIGIVSFLTPLKNRYLNERE